MELIRQHIALLAGAFILWFSYGHLTEEPEAAADKKKLQAIGPRYLAIRPDEQTAARLVDPYRFTVLEQEDSEDASTATGSSDDEEGMNSRSPSASREDGTDTSPLQGSPRSSRAPAVSPRGPNPNGGAKVGSGRGPNPNGGAKVGSGRGPNPNGGAKTGSGRGPNPNGGASGMGGNRSVVGPRGGFAPVFITDTGPASLPAMQGSVRLWVEAVLDIAGGGSARISGVRVEVGEAIPGLDDAAPPVLVSTSGMQATIRYRTVDYVLTLDAPSIVIEPRDPDASEAGDDGSWLDSLFPEDGT